MTKTLLIQAKKCQSSIVTKAWALKSERPGFEHQFRYLVIYDLKLH